MKRIVIVILALVAWSCSQTPVEKPLIVKEDPKQGAINAKLILESTPVQLADGLQISLWASDSLAPDPIALSIDDQNRIYLTITNRQKNSEFDIQWLSAWDDVLLFPGNQLKTVEPFFTKQFDSTRTKENEWLADLNNDGIQ